ncbi:MAG: T9SS type A sorting domain-containing protein [Bacteroidales bacterium]
MKKVYLLLVVLLSAMVISAQSVVLLYNDEPIEGNELPIFLNPTASINVSFIHIQNKLDKPLTLKVEIDKEGISAGNDLQMCFDNNCITGTVSDPVTLNANELYKNFDLLYTYENGSTSYVFVKFIDNGTDEVLKTLKVVYQIETATSVLQNGKDVRLSVTAQPNPASSSATFIYSVPNSYNDAKLIVRNSLGSIVKQSAIKTGIISKLNTNVSDLLNGVYFYSIIADSKVLVTKKLIIKH